METIDGYEDDRDPNTQVCHSSTPKCSTYHEIGEDLLPACQHEEAKRANLRYCSLELAIRRWNEPCQRPACQRIREEGAPPYRRAQLKYLYFTEDMTLEEIGEVYGVGKEAIRGIFETYGIQKRNKSQAQAVNVHGD